MIGVLLSLFTHLSEPQAREIVQVVQVESAKYELDPILIYSIIAIESRYQVKAIGSSHGERGLMQLKPKYHGQVPLDIKNNLKVGIKYLASMYRACYIKLGPAWPICYNTGPGIKLKNPTRFKYYVKVTEEYGKIKENLQSRPSLQSRGKTSHTSIY